MANRLENLTADILDDDFTDIFRPIQYVLTLFGCIRVQIKDGFATPPSKSIGLYMILLWSAHLVTQYYHYIQCAFTDGTFFNESHFKFAIIDISLPEIPLIIYEKFFTDEKRNCEIYVKLQKIDRHLNMEDRKKRNEFLTRLTKAVICVCLTTVTILTIVYNMYFIRNSCFPGYFVTWGPLVSYFNGVLITVILYYISVRVDYITKKLLNINKTNGENNLKIYYSRKSLLNDSLTDFDSKTWDDLLKSVHYIVTVISDFINLYQHRSLYIFVQTTLWALFFVERAILCLKYQTQLDTSLSTFLVLPLFLFLLLMYVKCTAASYLTSKLEKLRKLSVRIVHSSENETTRKYMKNMLLLLEVRSDLSLYDIVKMDTRLIGKLLVIIASYTMGLCYSSKFTN